jgi:hypothetical protein
MDSRSVKKWPVFQAVTNRDIQLPAFEEYTSFSDTRETGAVKEQSEEGVLLNRL